MNYYHNPVEIIFGESCIEKLKNICEEKHLNQVLVLTGGKSFNDKSKKIVNEITLLPSSKLIQGIRANPTIDDIFSYYLEVNEYQPDMIIAIGGGSVMDTAKALKAIINKKIESVDHLRKIIVEQDYSPSNAEMILVPTTAGTGSEVTKWATIWDKENKKKYSVDHSDLYADKAIVDPTLTYEIPIKLAVITALDAFSHALESYWSPKSNHMSREYSLTAIRLFRKNIDGMFEFGNKECREKVMLASVFAGLAFSHTRTTICHAISYPLTLHYHVPHGLATSLTLPFALQINEGYLYNREELFTALAIKKWSDVLEIVENVLSRVGIPSKLSDYGVTKKDISLLAKESYTPGRSDNNPVMIEARKIEKILQEIL